MRDAESPLPAWLLPVALLVLGLLALWTAAGGLASNIDDALITLRYSAMWVEGQGLVFNPGERVEGYSNPVWTVLCALPLVVGMDGLLGAKLMGMAFDVAAVCGALLLAWELVQPKRWPTALAVLAGAGLLAVSHPLRFWATAGLETTQYAALLVLALWRLSVERRAGGLPLSAALAGLAAISRPEAPLLVLSIVLVRAFTAWEQRAERGWTPVLAWGGAFAVPTFGWLFFRLAYYGAWVPNTFYRKTARERSWAEVGEYLSSWAGLEWLLLVAAFAGVVGILIWRCRSSVAVLTMIAAQGVFLYIAGSDWMPSMRFVVPVLPLVAAAAGIGAGRLVQALETRERVAWIPGGVLVFVLLVQAIRSVPVEQIRGGEVMARKSVHYFPASRDTQWGGSLEWVLADLAEVIPPGATLAYTEVGMVGYGSTWQILDIAGLITAETAGATGLSTAEQVAWVRAQSPEWMLLKESTAILVPELLASDWIWQEYERLPGPREGLILARRKDAPYATDAEVLENLAYATDKAPRFAILQQRRLRWVGALGETAERQALCEDLERYLPFKPQVIDSCKASLLTPLKRPVAKLAQGPQTAPVASPGEQGPVVPGALAPWWSPNESPSHRVYVAESVLHLQGGSDTPKLAYACLASEPLQEGLQVAYTWRGVPDAQGGGLADAVFYLRFLDRQDKLIESEGGPVRQRLARGGFGRAWSQERASVQAPEGAASVELCVTLNSEGAQLQVKEWAWGVN